MIVTISSAFYFIDMKKISEEIAFFVFILITSNVFNTAITASYIGKTEREHIENKYKEIIDNYENYHYCAEKLIDDMWEHDSEYYLDVITERSYYIGYISSATKIDTK